MVLNLIPQPKHLELFSTKFHLKPDTPIVLIGNAARELLPATILQERIFTVTGIRLAITASLSALKGGINLFYEGNSNEERYNITVAPQSIELRGASPRALFWAVQTLSQIVTLSGKKIPCLQLDDEPDFSLRGFYHDVTRGKVPTLATLKMIADTCAFYKINHLQLYVEHTFAFRAIPELWADKDPLTAEEILELDRYCHERHIELVPSLASFGHLYELLRLPRFEHLNELDIQASKEPHDLWDRMAHYTLDVSQEESFEVVRTMIEEYLPLFSSNYFNICCDETFDLGKGKNTERAEREGTGRLYVDFIKRIMRLVMEHGKTPMFWGDIILHHPELITQIPHEAIFLNWWYKADVTDESAKKFADAGVTQVMCPGVDGWSRFMNNIDNATQNIRKMCTYGKTYGALGVLNTDWGDCGHVNFLANSLHGLAWGAALSWNTQSFNNELAFDKVVSRLQWGDTKKRTAGLLRKLGSLNMYHLGNIYGWLNAHPEGKQWGNEHRVREWPFSVLAQKFQKAQTIQKELEVLRTNATENLHQDYDEFIWSAQATAWVLALLTFKKIHEYQQKGGAELLNRRQLIAQGRTLIKEFQKLWRQRNKESELRNVTSIFNHALARINEM